MATSDKFGNKGKPTQKSIKSEKMLHFSRKRQASDFDYRVFMDPLYGLALSCLHSEGLAVMSGPAQGGAGIMFTLYNDGERIKRFVGTPEEFTDFCYDVIETFGSTSEEALAAWGLPKREG